MRHEVFIDCETYSDLPIAQVGGYKYAENCTLLLVSYAIDEQPAKVIDCTCVNTWPKDLLVRLMDPDTVFIAHNAMFDRIVLRRYLPHFANPERWRDSMVRAYMHSLPGALGALCALLNVPTDKAKDAEGKKLVRFFCCPAPKSQGGGRRMPAQFPEEWAKFVEYNRLDTEAAREVWRLLPRWNCTDEIWQQWIYDQCINDMGMYIDTDLAQAAQRIAAAEKIAADLRIAEATDGAVTSIGQRDKLKQAIEAYGVKLVDMRADTLTRKLEDERLPREVRNMIAERLDNGKTSIKKYDKLLQATCKDHRLHGCLQFSGATRTMRWTGKLFQPQNLPRGSIKEEKDLHQAIADIKSGLLPFVSDKPIEVLSSCVRSCISAPKGHKLVVADLSNIEGRVLAWMAGEEWKLEAFRDFDRGEGPDLYEATYARTFGIKPQEVTKKQRQVGKVMELGLGYQGGVGAFLAFASVYGLDLDELAGHVRAAVSQGQWVASRSLLDWFKTKRLSRNGLSDETWIACDVIKSAWRAKHPAIARFWEAMGDCSRETVVDGKTRSYRGFTFDKVSGWLRIRLPSGRYLQYPNARPPQHGTRADFVFDGVDQMTKKWGAIATHGGKLTENCCQALARDVLAANLPALFEEGYYPVLSVHDEWITETPDTDQFSAKKLAELMTRVPAWAKGLPLNAAGFECKNYRKD